MYVKYRFFAGNIFSGRKNDKSETWIEESIMNA